MGRFIATAGMCALLIALGAGVIAGNMSSIRSTLIGTPTAPKVIEAVAAGDATLIQGTPVGATMISVPEMKDVPVYPGTYELGHGCKDYVLADCVYNFRTTDAEEQVIAYYKKVLGDNGWMLVAESSFLSHGLRFLRTTDKTDAPEAATRRYLKVGVEVAAVDGERTINLRFSLWPDPYKVPLYPIAEQVEVVWESNLKDGETLESPEFEWLHKELVTRYATDATPDEVRTYYDRVLPQHGWYKGQNHDYIYSRRIAGDGILGSEIDIDAQLDAGGKTRVEVRVGGNDLAPMGDWKY